MQNWLEQYDLTCASSSDLALVGTVYFIGVVLGSLTLPGISDKVGRKPISILGISLSFGAAIVVLYSSSLNVLWVMQFILGFSSCGRYFVGYLYFTEHWHVNEVSKATGVLFSCDALTLAVCTVYFKYISNNWKYLVMVTIVL